MLNEGSKTAGEIATEIRMTRAARSPQFPILIVEGKEDARFWKPRVEDDASVVVAGSRSALETVMRVWPPFVAAVRDADWDRILRRPVPDGPTCVTDAHDLETTLALWGAATALFGEFGAKAGRDLEWVLAICVELGAFRLMNVRSGAGVPMDWLSVRRYVTAELDRPRLYADALLYQLAPSPEALKSGLRSEPTLDRWQLINGHDLLAALALALALDSSRGEKDVAHGLRLAVQTDTVKASALWGCLDRWQRSQSVQLLKR